MNHRDIVTLITITLCDLKFNFFYKNSKRPERETHTNLTILSRSRNMIECSMKTYDLLTRNTIQKYFTLLQQSFLMFSTIRLLQAELLIQQRVFLQVISAWIVMSCPYRSSHPDMFLRKGVLKICSKLTGEHPCRSVISIKLQSNFIEMALWHGCSPVNLLHIFRTPFSRNTSRLLLLSLWGDKL